MTEQLAIEPASRVKWSLQGNFVFPEVFRQKALAYLNETPFPTTKDEEWKYTRVTKIKNGEFSVLPAVKEQSDFAVVEGSVRLVFVNGHFVQELSSETHPNGLKVMPLSGMSADELNTLAGLMKKESGVFSAFNTAFTTDGIYLHLSANCGISETIELVYITDGENALNTVRNHIVTERSSSLHVVQRFVSTGESSGFTNSVTEISVAQNARLTIDKIQEESTRQFQVARELVNQHTDSVFTINTITLNGALVRNDLRISVEGTNCETNLNGAYILKGNQHVDNHTVVDHRMPHCQSNELYKGVIDENATAVFNGKVFVRKDAQKINAFQSNANVLMSDSASVNSKPELEIYADDVKCSHGSTTGQIDEEAIFYLRSRGIGEANARKLMVAAFIEDVLSEIENEAVLHHIHKQLHENFAWEI